MLKQIRILFFLSIILFCSNSILAQGRVDSLRVIEEGDWVTLMAKIEGKDTIIVINLEPVEISSFPFPNTRHYRKLIYNVKKVYPYAKLASFKLNQYQKQLDSATTKRQKKRIMRKAEKELMDEFGEELKGLYVSQGKILVKLLDRETGNNSYELLKQLRGSFRAFFYQSVGRLFGYNLKIKYDPEGVDWEIERIVQMIESGVL